MTMNPLPPQAYTKETLLKAYQWLTGQNSSIKEMATNPDILVSLYLKATRDGDHALERPSIQNFKKELKSLAGILTELDKKAVPTNSPRPLSPPKPTTLPPHAQKSLPSEAPKAANTSQSQLSPHLTQTSDSFSAQEKKPLSFSEPTLQMQEFFVPTEKAENFSNSQNSFLESLDEASLNMIREVKSDFNLSHESEALRMLIKVGFVRAKSFLR